MSEWTDVKGKHNSRRVSMKKLVSLCLPHYEIGWFPQKNGEEFEFSMDSCGLEAAEAIAKIAKEFKRIDKRAILEMRAEIVFW